MKRVFFSGVFERTDQRQDLKLLWAAALPYSKMALVSVRILHHFQLSSFLSARTASFYKTSPSTFFTRSLLLLSSIRPILSMGENSIWVFQWVGGCFKRSIWEKPIQVVSLLENQLNALKLRQPLENLKEVVACVTSCIYAPV